MNGLQKKCLHTAVAFVFIGAVYNLLFPVPIYRLDPLALAYVVLVVIGFLGFIWKLE